MFLACACVEWTSAYLGLLQGAPNCESNPRVHTKMVLTTQVRAKLSPVPLLAHLATPSALFNCTRAIESDFGHTGAIQTRP